MQSASALFMFLTTCHLLYSQIEHLLVKHIAFQEPPLDKFYNRADPNVYQTLIELESSQRFQFT